MRICIVSRRGPEQRGAKSAGLAQHLADVRSRWVAGGSGECHNLDVKAFTEPLSGGQSSLYRGERVGGMDIGMRAHPCCSHADRLRKKQCRMTRIVLNTKMREDFMSHPNRVVERSRQLGCRSERAVCVNVQISQWREQHPFCRFRRVLFEANAVPCLHDHIKAMAADGRQPDVREPQRFSRELVGSHGRSVRTRQTATRPECGLVDLGIFENYPAL